MKLKEGDYITQQGVFYFKVERIAPFRLTEGKTDEYTVDMSYYLLGVRDDGTEDERLWEINDVKYVDEGLDSGLFSKVDFVEGKLEVVK